MSINTVRKRSADRGASATDLPRAPISFFQTVLLGVAPVEPGFAVFRLQAGPLQPVVRFRHGADAARRHSGGFGGFPESIGLQGDGTGKHRRSAAGRQAIDGGQPFVQYRARGTGLVVRTRSIGAARPTRVRCGETATFQSDRRFGPDGRSSALCSFLQRIEFDEPLDALVDCAGAILAVRILIHGKPAVVTAAVEPVKHLDT